jgi:hypothetical protein
MTKSEDGLPWQEGHDRDDLMLLMIMHMTQLQYIAWLENDASTDAETLAREEHVLQQLRERIRAMICPP